MDEAGGYAEPPVRGRSTLSSLALAALGVLLALAAQTAYRTWRGPDRAVAAEVGSIAPDLQLPGLSGAEVRLADFRGRTVLLNFRTTWCRYCRQEAPILQEAHATIDGLAVLSVYIQETAAQVSAYHAELGLTFPAVVDDRATAARTYRVEGIPQSFVIDAQGVITAAHLGPLTMEGVREYVESGK